MPHDILRTSSYDPETLTDLFQVFDEAWAELVACRIGNPANVEADRRNLAKVILELARLHREEPATLKQLAVSEMLKSLGNSGDPIRRAE